MGHEGGRRGRQLSEGDEVESGLGRLSSPLRIWLLLRVVFVATDYVGPTGVAPTCKVVAVSALVF